MKSIIIRFPYAALRNSAHVQFHVTVLSLLTKYTAEALGISELFTHYIALVANEQLALDTIVKSGLTDEMIEQDRMRDELFRGLVKTVDGSRNHFDPAKRAAANDLHLVLHHYGNLSSKPVDEETADISDLNQELMKPDHFAQLKVLGLEEWLTQLIMANQLFDKMMMARYSETAQRPKVNMRAARVAIDKQFRLMLDYIEALDLIGGNPKYDSFIDELNAVMARYEHLLAQEKGIRKAHADKEGEEEKPTL